MFHPLREFFISALLCAAAATAAAQTVYKCGNSYSETPCSNAVVVENRDERTREQKQQAETSTKASEKMASKLAAERTEREKKEAAANRKFAAEHAAKVRANTKRYSVTRVRPLPAQATPDGQADAPLSPKPPKPPKAPKASKPPKASKAA